MFQLPLECLGPHICEGSCYREGGGGRFSPGSGPASAHSCPCVWHGILQLCLLPVSSKDSSLQGQTVGFSHHVYFLLETHAALNNGSQPSQVTRVLQGTACARRLRKCKTRCPPAPLCSAVWGLLSGREVFPLGFSALGESSLKSCPESKGQVARWSMHCPVRPGAKGAVPRLAKNCPSLWKDHDKQARRSWPTLSPGQGIQLPPSAHLRTSGSPWKAKRFFQPGKRVGVPSLEG